MATLAEKIAKVTDPTPVIFDPEDDVNTETAAKFSDAFDENADISYEVSELRSKTAPLIEDIDPRYAGVKVSRKSLDNFEHPDVSITSEDDNQSEGALEGDYDSIGSDEVDTDDDDEEDLENFRKQIQNKSSNRKEEEHSAEESEEDSDVEEKEGITNVMQQFSNIDVASDIEKAKTVQSQLELWDRLCEIRIKLQRLLLIANKLPQHYSWNDFQDSGGTEFSDNTNKGYNGMKQVLENLFELETELLSGTKETRSLESETYSSSDDEVKTENVIPKRKPKQKLDNSEDCLEERHKSFIPYRNEVINKWDQKTKLAAGRMQQNSFVALENSAIKQIEQVLQDESRLLKRTQLKRSHYRVLGTLEVYDTENPESNDLNTKKSKQDLTLKDYDPEIFDDDDFYHQLLKDIMESKSLGIDPAVLKKQHEIQKIRSKLRRKVDTKASKGRKIRYDVHPKLVNFMAPEAVLTMPDEAIDNLNKSLFGRRLC